MDPITLILTVIGTVAGVAAVVVGMLQYLEQRQERAKRKVASAEEAKSAILRIPNNLPPRGEFIGREKEKAQIREALASRSYLISCEPTAVLRSTLSLR